MIRFLLVALQLISFVFIPAKVFSQSYSVSGYITDIDNGESLIGATAFVKGTSYGISSNVYGFYSLSLPKGKHIVSFSYIGYNPQNFELNVDSNIVLKVKLSSIKTQLTEFVITTEAGEEKKEVSSTQMGMITIPIERIKSIPTIGGETDIIKVMQLMPGVKRGGEGQTGMFVRGGTGDGNLILLDEAVVYNVSHLFGFFSVFNNDALKDVVMYKGGFPAMYGGRLSSVMDIRMKEGDQQKFHAEGGIGLLSSRLTIQGPILKDKMSFIVSGRRSYIDKVFKLVNANIPYYFYDLNTKINYKISDKDRIFISAYNGDDVLAAQEDSSLFDGGFNIGNFTTSARWNHLYNAKLFSNISIIHTRFRYDIRAEVPGNSFLVKSKINDIGAKADYNYYYNSKNTITFGGLVTNHNFRPNIVNTSGEISEFLDSREGNLISTQEIGLYANNDQTIDSTLKINYGLRLSGTVTKGKLYAGLEPRFSATYSFSESNSLKFGYSRMKQYMHLVSSSSIALPTDLWYPVTKNVKPQTSDQLALGYTHHLERIKSMLTIEGYYKWMNNLIEYREGAVLLLNDHYEEELIEGKGNAYGIEFFLNKTKGKFTGWIGYTLSWSTRQFDELNNGKKYYAKYDRRHDFSFVGTYDFTKRFAISAVWVYSTGSRFTPSTGNFFMPNATLTQVDILSIYADKNSIILPPSHRLDLNFVVKNKRSRKWEGEWHFGGYNIYNQAQPYRVDIVGNENGTYKYQATGLFGFIPSVAYNFKF